MSKTYSFFQNCVGWEPDDVHSEGGLNSLIDDRIQITRSTFLKHVDGDEIKEIASQLGYNAHPKQGLTMAADWHIEYFRSKHHNERVYGFRHSAIEFVFKLSQDA
jgi:hypothetical protein